MAYEITSRLRRRSHGNPPTGEVISVQTLRELGSDPLNAALSLLPEIGSQCPEDELALLDEIDIELLSSGVARATLYYRRPQPQPQPTQYRIVGSLAQHEVSKDINGNDIVVYDPGASSSEGAQKVPVLRMTPQITLEVRRIETFPTGDPLEKVVAYTGTVNANTWCYLPAGHWMCTVSGSSNDGGQTWEMVYTFEGRVPYQESPEYNMWEPVVFWRDETGDIPADAEGVQPQLYRRVDFSALFDL